jgi:hypothetical protein
MSLNIINNNFLMGLFYVVNPGIDASRKQKVSQDLYPGEKEVIIF